MYRECHACGWVIYDFGLQFRADSILERLFLAQLCCIAISRCKMSIHPGRVTLALTAAAKPEILQPETSAAQSSTPDMIHPHPHNKIPTLTTELTHFQLEL